MLELLREKGFVRKAMVEEGMFEWKITMRGLMLHSMLESIAADVDVLAVAKMSLEQRAPLKHKIEAKAVELSKMFPDLCHNDTTAVTVGYN